MSDETNEKETVPPPPDGGEIAEDERTVMANVPQDLIAQLSEGREEAPGEAISTPPASAEGGLRQMFARNPLHIRDVLPTEAEGDALLDMLFDDATSVADPPEAATRETEVDPEELDAPTAIAMPSPPAATPPPMAASPSPPPMAASPSPPPMAASPLPAPAPPRPPPPRRPAPSRDLPDLAEDEDVKPTPGPVSFPSAGPPRVSAPSMTADVIDLPDDEDDAPTRMRFDEADDALAPELLGGDDFAVAPSPSAPPAFPVTPRPAEVDVAAEVEASDEGELEDPEGAESGLVESTPVDDLPLEDVPEEAAPVRPSAPPQHGRPRAGLPSLALSEEREASLVLSESRSRDAFAARAHWLLEEARLLEDRAARSAQLLVVSELLAMVGDDEEAAAIALEARDAQPQMPLVTRQHRAMLAKKGDFTAVLEAVDAETRAMPTPEARCHGAWLGAEIARVVLGDDAGAHRRAEQAMRVLPADPRPHVQRVVDAIAGRSERPIPVGKARPVGVAELPHLAPIDEACVHLARLRGETVRGDDVLPRTPFESVLEVRSALEAGDRVAAVDGLANVATDSLLGGQWLVGMLADVHSSSRQRAIESFQAVAGGSHGAFARRALAATAVALGDAVGAHEAANGDGSFDVADRLALASLAAVDVSLARRDLEAAAADPDFAPLAVAASGALPAADEADRPEIIVVGSPRAQAAMRVGKRLGALCRPVVSEEAATAQTVSLREANEALFAAEAQPGQGGAGVAAALGIELDLAEHRAADVARALERWGAEDGNVDATRLLAAGLVAEVAGDPETARGAFERAAEADPAHEGATRALAAHLEPAEVPGLLAEHGAALPPGPRPALLFLEAALRLLTLGAETEAETVLLRASQADASLPFAPQLLERLARKRGDRDALLDSLRARRDSSDDPVERAHDFVREALLLSDAEDSSSSSLLEQALAGQPDDVALRELYERLAPEPPSDRATWREQRAGRSTGAEATALALEAALDFERAGDVASAARCVKLAAERAEGAPADGDPLLLPLYAHRYGVAGHGTADLVDALLPLARAAEDPHARREIYERLAELDELGRGDIASGVLWRRTILEEDPGHLPTLRRIETALMRENRVDELEPIALEIARALEGPEMVAHATLAARLRSRIAWDESFDAAKLAYAYHPRGPWVLRQMAAHARVKGDAALALEVEQQLLAATERPGEIAALSLRVARSAVGLGDGELAASSYAAAAQAMPTHLLARLEFAGALEGSSDFEGAAHQLEAAAECAASPAWKVALDFEAAVFWQDQVGDKERARAALERVSVADPKHDGAFERLRGLYVEADARGELAELLERRLDSITDPGERVEMEVMRGRALAQVGEHAAAKLALAAALEASPDHVDALGAFCDLCVEEEDWDGAEQALIRLARLSQGVEPQIAIYLRLGDLYDQHLPNPERAELAYGEILKRSPGHAQARERLVTLFRREGDFGRAIEEQNILVASAEQPDDKALRTVQLAGIIEAMGDVKKAEATLVAARKAFPKSSVALEALVALYQRTGQQQAGTMLLERAVADARRALATGRFDGYLFGTLAAAASLRGKQDASLACRSVVESLEGTIGSEGPAMVQGAGERAGDADLDDLVAPELLSPAFRDLLARTGPMLDTALPYDPASIRATPLPPPSTEVGEEIRDVALGYGIHRLEILVSGVLGHVCIAASAHPPTVVLGQGLLAPENADVRAYLVHRALKVIQANAVVFARTAPIDLWPLLAAYLKCFTPGWNPQGVDATRLTNFYGRLSRAVPPGLPHDTGALAQEIIGTIGNRAPTLNTAVNGWGDRCALLALGDPAISLKAIAWAGGHTNAPPPAGKERLVWVGRNAEAREIVLFAVSDAYVEARQRLGIGD